MSYTSPKYTYVSQQPAFDKLQKDIVGAAADIAKKKQDHIDAERKKGEENVTVPKWCFYACHGFE